MTDVLLRPFLMGLAFVLGAVWGSFLNVVIYRLPRGESVVSPRSRCPGCGQLIAWYDNVPILSWLVLRARCRRCKKRISPRYVLIELMCGLLATALMRSFGPSAAFLVYFVFALLLVAISFIDLERWLIPDKLSLPGIALGLGGSLLLPGQPWLSHALGAVAGGGGLWLVAVSVERLLKKEGMGLGDVKLLAMIGAFTGVESLPWVVLLASAQGALIGGVWLLARRGAPPPEPQDDGWVPPATAVPFGPFLAVAALEVLFFRERLFALALGIM